MMTTINVNEKAIVDSEISFKEITNGENLIIDVHDTTVCLTKETMVEEIVNDNNNILPSCFVDEIQKKEMMNIDNTNGIETKNENSIIVPVEESVNEDTTLKSIIDESNNIVDNDIIEKDCIISSDIKIQEETLPKEQMNLTSLSLEELIINDNQNEKENHVVHNNNDEKELCKDIMLDTEQNINNYCEEGISIVNTDDENILEKVMTDVPDIVSESQQQQENVIDEINIYANNNVEISQTPLDSINNIQNIEIVVTTEEIKILNENNNIIDTNNDDKSISSCSKPLIEISQEMKDDVINKSQNGNDVEVEDQTSPTNESGDGLDQIKQESIEAECLTKERVNDLKSNNNINCENLNISMCDNNVIVTEQVLIMENENNNNNVKQNIDGVINSNVVIDNNDLNDPKNLVIIPIFRNIPAKQIVQGCIHNVLSIMRSDNKYTNPLRYNEEMIYNNNNNNYNNNIGGNNEFSLSVHPLYTQLQDLLLNINGHKINNINSIINNERSPSTNTHVDSDDEDDSNGDDNESENDNDDESNDECESDNDDDEEGEDEEDDDDSIEEHENALFLEVFCNAVKRSDVGATVTGAVIASLYKFITYDLLSPDNEINTTMTSKTGISLIANSLIHCAFEEASDPIAITDSTSLPVTKKGTNVNGGSTNSLIVGPTFAVSNADAEQSVLKLLDVIVATIDYSIHHGHLLPQDMVTGLLLTCLHVSHRAASATSLLRTAAFSAATNVVMSIFHEKLSNDDVSSYRLSTFQTLTNMLQSSSTYSPTPSLTASVFTLLCTAIESSRDSFIGKTEKDFLQTEVYKILLSTAMETRDCVVLEGAIRAVFNLWISMRHDLKSEFEVFLQSVHFRILDGTRQTTLSPGRWRRAASNVSTLDMSEAREIVLTNLLDICHVDHTTLQDIYLNYDCDVACSDVWKTILVALGKAALPSSSIKDGKPNSSPSNINRVDSSSHETNTAIVLIDKDAIVPIVGEPVSTEVECTELALIPSNINPQPSSTRSSSMTSDIQQTGRVVPLNQLNHLALDGILSIVFSTPYHKTEGNALTDSVSNDIKNDNNFIFEVSKTGQIVALSEDVLLSRKRRKQSLEKLAHSFNGSHGTDTWLEVAVAEGLMPKSYPLTSFQAAKVAADLLYSAGDLDKTKLGTYLCIGPEQRYPFEFMLRKEFAALYDFRDMSFPVALRAFLSKFRMPGEAQCIDRIIEVFSREYYEQQGSSSAFKNSDAVYVLAFSTIMLNTDLHNRTIKAEKRMTREQFVRNNRGINAGDDLDEAFLTDLYDQIKEREIQVRKEVGEFIATTEYENFRTALDELHSKKREMSRPLFTRRMKDQERTALNHDKEMFLILANISVPALKGIFLRTKNDSAVIKALRGLQHLVKVADFYGYDSLINDIVQLLLSQGREYITSCLALDYTTPEDGAPVGAGHTKQVSIDSLDEDRILIDTDQPIPYGLLCSRESSGVVNISGSAAHRGLLSLDTGFILFRKYAPRITESWPTFIECLCALRDARALPNGLSELDDFADSNGKVLPLSTFALSSKKALDDHYRSIAEKDMNKNKGWFRSLFRGNKGMDSEELLDERSIIQSNGEPSLYLKALLRVAEAADVEDAVQMGSMKLPDETITSLLATVSEYPFVNDPVGEQQAVFSMELAARALLSDRDNATVLFPRFLSTFESIMCRISDEKILSPFVIERIVVAILRSSIHLYEIPELRPNLRSSLQLLTMTLPKSFIRVIADRMSCGMAIILRASFHFFESVNEWTFMGETLDMLANYSTSREFVFDGIASTVEYAIPNAKDNVENEERHPLSMEACNSLSRILIRFTLGFYKGDLSLTVPAMLCLEKLYRYKVGLLLSSTIEIETEQPPIDQTSTVPDKELWQNIAVAVYAVCRSPDPESSKHGLDCFRRIILRTDVTEIPDEKWIAILYLMVNKQPPLAAEVSRGNTFALLGHLLARVLPVISNIKEINDDLVDLINQVAALTKENLLECKRGSSSPVFEKTLQTATYLSNHMSSDEWTGESIFSAWACETILKELECAGESVRAYEENQNNTISDTIDSEVEKEHGDESEVSELSVTETNGEDE